MTEKNRIWRRMLSMLLLLSFILSYVPVGVWAVEDTAVSENAISPGWPVLDTELTHIICYGQSFSTGSDAPYYPDATVDNVYVYGGITNSANGTELQHLSGSAANQHPIISAGNVFAKLLSGAGIDTDIVLGSYGSGGKTIAQLMSAQRQAEIKEEEGYTYDILSSGRYTVFRNSVSALSQYAQNSNKSISCPAIVYLQGETDQNTDAQLGYPDNPARAGYGAGGDKEKYKEYMSRLKEDMQREVMEAYGQTEKPLFFIYQVSGTYTRTQYSSINMAQIEFAQENDDVILVQTPYFTSHYTNSHHLTQNGYRWLGEYIGRSMYTALVEREKPWPMLPQSIELVDGNLVRITVSGAQGGLTIDTWTVENASNSKNLYGFYLQADGQTIVPTNVSVSGNSIELTLPGYLTAETVFVYYAGRHASGTGNVRDNSTELGFYEYLDDSNDTGTGNNQGVSHSAEDANGNSIIGQKYPMYHWLASFCYEIQVPEAAKRRAAVYQWEMQEDGLVSVTEGNATQNNLTLLQGSVEDGVLTGARYTMEKAIVLEHDRLWAIEWKSAGNGNSFGGGKLLSSSGGHDSGAQYLYLPADSRSMVAWGVGSHSANFGFKLASFGIDAREEHVYRIENRIADDGTNNVYLIVDDVEIGPMTTGYRTSSNTSGAAGSVIDEPSNWVNGKNIYLDCIGEGGSFLLKNLKLSYLKVWEDDPSHTHTYESVVTAPTCTKKGYTVYTCTCGDSYRTPWLDEGAYEGKTIACVGDSITAGVGVTKDENDYVKLLADQLGMEYIRLGASGTTLCTDGSRTCCISNLTESKLNGADVVTIALGINDFCIAGTGYYELGDIHSTDGSTIYGAARMWCERIQELRKTDSLSDTQFYFLTPVITSRNISVTSARNWDQSKTNIHGYTLRDLCNAIIEVAALYDVAVIDLNLLSGMYYVDAQDNNTATFGGDGVHPGANGHAMMANAIADALLQNNLRDDHTHTYGSWITTTWPSCANGEQQRVCAICSATESRETEPGADHTYENGSCTVCGEAQPGPTITKQPTDAEAALGEKFAVTVEAEGDGLTYQWYCRKADQEKFTQSSAAGNSFSGIMEQDLDNCQVYCVITDNDGRAVTSDTACLVLKHSHHYTGTVTTPTCTEQGYTTYTCDCGDHYVADFVDATGHTYENGVCVACGKSNLCEVNAPVDLFVFSGQSNMMGAAVLEPQVNTFTDMAWEYKYMPKLRGAETGLFVSAGNAAGEWHYIDLEAAYGDALYDLSYQSTLSNYSANTYFCPAMRNGTKGFSAQSEANMYPSASLPPYFATEYASYGHSSIYAHMAKGAVKIIHYFTPDMMNAYNALISTYNTENNKSYKLLTAGDLSGAGYAFDAKYNAMLEDYAACAPGGSINNKCFVWLQGEGDVGSYIEYKLKMQVLWEHLQTLGFTHFFVLRVGYWGNTRILDVIKAQEDFCAENENCYIITRAPSLIPHPGASTENWWISEPGAEYDNCRDSYLVESSGNHHFNEKAMQLFAERSAKNIHRILYLGLDPVLEEENIQGMLGIEDDDKPEEGQPEDTSRYTSYIGTESFCVGLSVSKSSDKWVEKASSSAASTELIPVTSGDSVWIQYVFFLSEAHAVGGFYDKAGKLVAPLYYKDFGFSLGGGGGTAAFRTPEATNRISIADVESATGKEIAFVRFTAWQASAGGHANTEARIYHYHLYTESVAAPTCTEGGYTTYTCACGHSYVGDEVEATGHKYETVVTAPNCTEGGYTSYTCACGYSYVGDEVEATGHKYEAVVTVPTCTEGGYTTHTCACGYSYVDDEVEATGHKYEAVVTVPTCAEQGYTTHACVCGHSYSSDYLDARGYDWMLEDGAFKILLIGNSFSEDASNAGMPNSQMLDILQAMLGEDVSVTVGLCYSGGKGLNWHATQSEQGNKSYSLRVISTENGSWKSLGSYTSADALTWTNWDVVSLQHYEINTSTGKESNAYPDQVDPKFDQLKPATEFMLDYVDQYAPNAAVYFYMHWARTYKPNLNESLATYNKMAAFFPEVLDYAGTESANRFETIIPVGLSVQNARTTYLATLAYNTTAYADKTLNLNTDAQIGLLRDTGHLSYNIGRYIAALTFAETIIPDELRADGYVLPDIRVTESVGKLPKEYTTIAQKSVLAAVESWKQGSLAVTEIEGYTEDPTVAAGATLSAADLNVSCGAGSEEIAAAVLAVLPADFAVDSVILSQEQTLKPGDTFTCQVTIRFGYTSLTVTAKGSVMEHKYEAVVTAPTCTEGGYTTYTCTACDHSYVGDEVTAIGHNYETVVTEPTCTEGGYTTYTCACGHSYVGDEVEATGHKYESVVTEPTCTEGGYTTYTCVCGHSYVDNEVEATGHNYETVVTEPTCTEQGYTTYTCACGYSYVGNEVEATGHKYETIVTKPTCTKDGYTTYTCFCGYSYVGNEVEARGHSAVVDMAVAPTCTETGLTEGKHCAVCSVVLTKQEVIPAKGHSAGAPVKEKETSEGFDWVVYCEDCGLELSREYVQTYTPGDINGDGKLNSRDATRLFQYLAGWDVEVDEAALDVNGDGKINSRDATRLFQYLAGWDVEIY